MKITLQLYAANHPQTGGFYQNIAQHCEQQLTGLEYPVLDYIEARMSQNNCVEALPLEQLEHNLQSLLQSDPRDYTDLMTQQILERDYRLLDVCCVEHPDTLAHISLGAYIAAASSQFECRNLPPSLATAQAFYYMQQGTEETLILIQHSPSKSFAPQSIRFIFDDLAFLNSHLADFTDKGMVHFQAQLRSLCRYTTGQDYHKGQHFKHSKQAQLSQPLIERLQAQFGTGWEVVLCDNRYTGQLLTQRHLFELKTNEMVSDGLSQDLHYLLDQHLMDMRQLKAG